MDADVITGAYFGCCRFSDKFFLQRERLPYLGSILASIPLLSLQGAVINCPLCLLLDVQRFFDSAIVNLFLFLAALGPISVMEPLLRRQ